MVNTDCKKLVLLFPQIRTSRNRHLIPHVYLHQIHNHIMINAIKFWQTCQSINDAALFHFESFFFNYTAQSWQHLIVFVKSSLESSRETSQGE